MVRWLVSTGLRSLWLPYAFLAVEYLAVDLTAIHQITGHFMTLQLSRFPNQSLVVISLTNDIYHFVNRCVPVYSPITPPTASSAAKPVISDILRR